MGKSTDERAQGQQDSGKATGTMAHGKRYRSKMHRGKGTEAVLILT